LAAREEQRLQPELLAQRLRAALEILLVLPGADDFAQLGEVRREDARALVARVVVALGVDQHALPGAARGTDHLRDVVQPALAVVGKDDHVALGQRAAEVLELGREHLARRRLFEVDAQELLAAADDAQLLRGGQAAVVVQARVDAHFFQQLLERPAGLVAADHREQARARAELGAVPGDVGRTAQALVFAANQNDGYRSLRRNARHLAEPVAVEHHVADHQHPGLRGVYVFLPAFMLFSLWGSTRFPAPG